MYRISNNIINFYLMNKKIKFIFYYHLIKGKYKYYNTN